MFDWMIRLIGLGFSSQGYRSDANADLVLAITSRPCFLLVSIAMMTGTAGPSPWRRIK